MRTRVVSALLASFLALPLVLTASCGGDDDEDAEPFDTLADCYDDHHNEENLSVQEAIVVCCIDHPIAGEHPSCGATAAACVTHVTTELGSEAAAAEVDAACAAYVDELDN